MADFFGFAPLEANFTPTPNQFFDTVIQGDFPKCVIVVVAVLIRETVGWRDPVTGERRIEAELPLQRIAEKGNLSINSAREGVRKAIEVGFVIETACHDNRHGARYALRWEDTDRQKEAIARTRRAIQDRLSESQSGPPIFGPPIFGPNKRKRCSRKKEKVFIKKENSTLNVVPEPEPAPLQRPTPNALRDDADKTIEPAIQEVLTLTGDSRSQRRFEQLYEIACRREARAAWQSALLATRSRLARSTPLLKPGAYFCRICLQELEKREIFVPTAAEKEADANAHRLIQQSLALATETWERLDGESVPPDQTGAAVPRPSDHSPSFAPADVPSLPIPSSHDLLASGSPGFRAFCAAERDRLVQELAGMSEGPRQHLLAAFDSPQRQQALFARWHEQRGITSVRE